MGYDKVLGFDCQSVFLLTSSRLWSLEIQCAF